MNNYIQHVVLNASILYMQVPQYSVLDPVFFNISICSSNFQITQSWERKVDYICNSVSSSSHHNTRKILERVQRIAKNIARGFEATKRTNRWKFYRDQYKLKIRKNFLAVRAVKYLNNLTLQVMGIHYWRFIRL